MQFKDLFNPYKYYRFVKIRIKRYSLMRRLKSVGDNFLFDVESYILTPEHMEIGNNVFIGEFAHISADLKIGNNVMFGPRPIIIGGNHYFGVKGRSNFTLRPQGRENTGLISIEDDTWFGAGVVILKGVTTGIGTIVGAGSVVTKSLPPFCVSVGNPCRPIKRVFDDSTLYDHLVELGYPEEFARKTVQRRNMELERWGSENLSVIDQTGTYWETKDTV